MSNIFLMLMLLLTSCHATHTVEHSVTEKEQVSDSTHASLQSLLTSDSIDMKIHITTLTETGFSPPVCPGTLQETQPYPSITGVGGEHPRPPYKRSVAITDITLSRVKREDGCAINTTEQHLQSCSNDTLSKDRTAMPKQLLLPALLLAIIVIALLIRRRA